MVLFYWIAIVPPELECIKVLYIYKIIITGSEIGKTRFVVGNIWLNWHGN